MLAMTQIDDIRRQEGSRGIPPKGFTKGCTKNMQVAWS